VLVIDIDEVVHDGALALVPMPSRFSTLSQCSPRPSLFGLFLSSGSEEDLLLSATCAVI
jgi:hypothetical protein